MLEGVALQGDLLAILDLTGRVRGPSVVLDVVLYCLRTLRLWLVWAGRRGRVTRPGFRGLAWLVGLAVVGVSWLQGVLYLEHVCLW